jgi:hypothetical protein
VGLGLNKREDAFDLKSCLADQSRSIQAEEKGVDLGIEGVSSDLLSGFSAGQKLTLKVGGMGGGGAGGGGAKPLAAAGSSAPRTLAPPGSAPKPLAPPGAKQQPAGGGGGGDDLLGLGLGGLHLGGAAPATTAEAKKPAMAPQQPAGEGWVSFD